MSSKSRALLLCCAMSAVPGITVAAPPADSPYATDPQNLYVQDATAQGIGSLNMVLCVIGSMDPGDMVNAGPYIALVDMNKCQANKGGSDNSAGATNFANAVVNVTRASNNDPMIGKVWLSLTEEGHVTSVFAYLSATQSPASAPPYGAFRMDYIGEIGGNGGGGGSSVTFNFAYDPANFRRSDGTRDECFDRSKAAASTAVWQYGTYNANDGTRVDQANPGFPIQATYSGASYYGFANYWGINFQGLTLPSGTPISGLSVTDQRPNNTTTYNLSKVAGKLTKWTQVSTTLGSLDGIPITYNADLTGVTTGNPAVTGVNSWVLQWNSGGTFTVVGTQNCGSNGCVTSTISPAATMTKPVVNAAPKVIDGVVQ